MGEGLGFRVRVSGEGGVSGFGCCQCTPCLADKDAATATDMQTCRDVDSTKAVAD